jgi:hypothetical protein
MDGAEVEEFIAERVALLLLCKHVLEREREFAQAGGFGPGELILFVAGKFNVGEEAAPAMRALFEACRKLIGERFAQKLELIGR